MAIPLTGLVSTMINTPAGTHQTFVAAFAALNPYDPERPFKIGLLASRSRRRGVRAFFTRASPETEVGDRAEMARVGAGVA